MLPCMRPVGSPREGRFKLKYNICCPAWIRTTVNGFKVRCPTIRRRGTGVAERT